MNNYERQFDASNGIDLRRLKITSLEVLEMIEQARTLTNESNRHER